jgi:hypothetical protein
VQHAEQPEQQAAGQPKGQPAAQVPADFLPRPVQPLGRFNITNMAGDLPGGECGEHQAKEPVDQPTGQPTGHITGQQVGQAAGGQHAEDKVG